MVLTIAIVLPVGQNVRLQRGNLNQAHPGSYQLVFNLALGIRDCVEPRPNMGERHGHRTHPRAILSTSQAEAIHIWPYYSSLS